MPGRPRHALGNAHARDVVRGILSKCDEAIGVVGLWEMMSRYEDRHALVTCTLAAVHVSRIGGEVVEGGTPELFVGTIEGAVLGPPRGDVKHGKASWNSVFTPDGYDKTFGELQFHEQATFSHRKRAGDTAGVV